MNFKGSHQFQDSSAKVSNQHLKLARLSDKGVYSLLSSRALYSIFLEQSLTEADLYVLFCFVLFPLQPNTGSEHRWEGPRSRAENGADIFKL